MNIIAQNKIKQSLIPSQRTFFKQIASSAKPIQSFNSNSDTQSNLKTKLLTPNANQVLAFCGGKSLNLAQTYEQIKTYGKFPPDIKENIEKELENGNPEDKKLINIHREKYDLLNQLDSLEEVKLFFPEFENVLSDGDVKYSQNSFIDDVKKGKLEYFDPEKDLSLQLLQMYWGDGFSLNDLKNNFSNVSLERTLTKLQIPTIDRIYAHYLKFSDKKYNDEITQLMSQKASKNRTKASQNKKIDKSIDSKENKEKTKRAPLSPEHKKKISESLIEYYKQNPHNATDVTDENLKRFKTEEEKEIFSQIMQRAWNYSECKSVKKAMSKFMKKEINDEEIKQIMQEDSPLRRNLSGFYKKNPWAKAQLSKAMKKSWEKQRSLNELGLNFDFVAEVKVFPTQMAQEIEKIAKIPDLAKRASYYSIPDKRDLDNIRDSFMYSSTTQQMEDKIGEIFRANINNLSARIADVLFGAIADVYLDFYYETKENGKFDKNFKEIDKFFYETFLNKYERHDSSFEANELQAIYNGLITIFYYKQDNIKQIKRMNTILEETYKNYNQMGQDKYSKRTHQTIMKAARLHYDYKKITPRLINPDVIQN